MEKQESMLRGSDSQSPSDNEKHIDKSSPIDIINQEGPDPDAHLTEEERRKIVSVEKSYLQCTISPYTRPGQKAPVEARHPSYPMAFPIVSALIPW